MEFLASDGVIINYRVTGVGPPVLFVHGWTMDGSVFVRQQNLSGKQVISLDLRGHGDSGKNSQMDVSFARMGQDISELLDYLELKDVVLAGWSMGVTIILSNLDLLQRFARAFVFIAGTPKFIASEVYPYGMRSVVAARLRNGLTQSYRTALLGFYHLLFFSEQVDDVIRSSLSEIYKRLVELCPKEIALAVLDQLYSADLRAVLPGIKQPVFIISGTLDKICFSDSARYLHEQIAGSRLALVEDAGHMPFFTRPDQFNQILESYLAECT